MGDSTTKIESNTTITVRLDGNAPSTVVYESAGDEFITVTARALDTDVVGLDTVLEVLGPSGFRLAYSDAHSGHLDDTLAAADAAVEHVYLPASGSYQIRVDTFSGAVAGDVDVSLRVLDPVSYLEDESNGVIRLTVEPEQGQTFFYPLTLENAHAYTITARSLSGQQDPILMLHDANGVVLAENDDHETGDLRLNIFDAQIANFTIDNETDGVIELREFLGRSGKFEILIEMRSN